MTRRISNQKSEQFRRMLRLALSVSAVSSSFLAGSQSLVGLEVPNAENISTQLELPQFPLEGAVATGSSAVQTRTTGVNSTARVVIIQRWLGLGQRVDFASTTASGSPGVLKPESLPIPVPSNNATTELPLSNATWLTPEDATKACTESECNGTVSNGEVSEFKQLPPLTIGSPMSVKQMVVTASATEQGAAVVESLSDKPLSTPSASDSIDPIDLMNSLEVNSSDEGLSTSLSFSDQAAVESDRQTSVQKLPQLSAGTTSRVAPPSREPQIVLSRQPMLLLTNSQKQSLSTVNTVEPKGRIVTSSSQSKDARNVSADGQTVQQNETSSRREVRPEPMKIQILGQSKGESRTPQSTTQREPLVAILTNYPTDRKPELPESPGASLKEMMQSERANQSQQTSATDLSVTPTNKSDSSDHQAVSQADAKVVDTHQHYTVGVRQSVQLKCDNPIQGVSVEKEEICQLIQTGLRSYNLVGLQEGVTRVALITEVSGQQQIEILQVTVGGRAEAGTDLASLAQTIGQTIRHLYPLERVTVEAKDQRIVVSGRVDSEETARKIIGLVRKNALTPVVDQLTTY